MDESLQVRAHVYCKRHRLGFHAVDAEMDCTGVTLYDRIHWGGSELAVLASLIDSLGVAADSLYCGKDAQSFYEEFETTRCLTD